MIDARSEKVLATLHPQVQAVMRSFLVAAKAIAAKSGLEVKAISGLRTYQEQDALYAKGRTAPGPVVTKARGGFSNHNFGLAIDIGVFSADGKKYFDEHNLYDELGALGQSLSLEWGGAWKTIVDKPHYQFRPEWARGLAEREFLASLRARVEQKKDILA
jgi:peptidoglycan L-alanyl-D-glutamate endopeptidase CwlK